MALRALIIANERFADGEIPPLSSPVSDAQRLKALLEREDVGGYAVELCDNASSVDARHAVQEFFDSGAPDDLQLLILSGHGLKDRWSRLYFATADTMKARLAASSLEARYVRERMDDGRAGRKVLIIDACYSGAFLDGMVPKKAGDLEIVREDFGSQATRGVSIITASTAVQLAGEKEVDGAVQSVFTRCMIEAIETGAADASGDGMITLTDLFDHVSRRMRTEAPGQTPQCLDLSHGGSMVVARNPAWQPAVLPDALIALIGSKERHSRILAVEDLAHLVRANDPATDKAIAALRTLAQDDSQAVQQFAQATLVQLGAMGGESRPTPHKTGPDEAKDDGIDADAGDDTPPASDEDSPARQTLLGGGGGMQAGPVEPPLVGPEPAKPDPVTLEPKPLPDPVPPSLDLLEWLRALPQRTKLIAGGVIAAAVLAIILMMMPPAPIPDPPVVNNSVVDNMAGSDIEASCARGVGKDCTILARALNTPDASPDDLAKALDYFRKACDANDAIGCSNAGYMITSGQGIAPNDASAVDYYRKGCDLDEAAACHNLGIFYENGRGGLSTDIERAALLFNKGCDGNFVTACASAGRYYESGNTSLGKDIQKANMLYRRACDSGVASGCAFIGENLFRALGVDKDEAEAKRLLDKACTAGNNYGCKRLNEYFPPVATLPGASEQLIR